MVLKPIWGRGSAGVELVPSAGQLAERLPQLVASGEFGDAVLVKQYLAGQEITTTVFPPVASWSMVILNTGRTTGAGPRSGALITRVVLHPITAQWRLLRTVRYWMPLNLLAKSSSRYYACATAARLVAARAPIRIDCRQGPDSNTYYLFDLNMKPNMPGAGRPGRDNQDNLSALAARAIGWRYIDSLENMLLQAWSRTQSH